MPNEVRQVTSWDCICQTYNSGAPRMIIRKDCPWHNREDAIDTAAPTGAAMPQPIGAEQLSLRYWSEKLLAAQQRIIDMEYQLIARTYERAALLWLKKNIGPNLDYERAKTVIENALESSDE